GIEGRLHQEVDHAEYSVERSANLVAHGREETAFRSRRCECGIASLDEPLVGLLEFTRESPYFAGLSLEPRLGLLMYGHVSPRDQLRDFATDRKLCDRDLGGNQPAVDGLMNPFELVRSLRTRESVCSDGAQRRT